MEGRPKVHVGIIGGGCSGVLVALSISRHTKNPVEIDIIEASGDFGPGLAYSTKDINHSLNIAIIRGSAYPEEPENFLDWVKQNKDSGAQKKDYVPRMWYGDYLRDQVDQCEKMISNKGGILNKITGKAISLEKHSNGQMSVTINLSDGSEEVKRYDSVVLASGNLPPKIPKMFESLEGQEHIYLSPWVEGSLEKFPPDTPNDTVLLFGSGLTAIDAALTLGNQGVKTVAVSRSGQLPKVHADDLFKYLPPPPEWPTTPHTLPFEFVEEKIINHMKSLAEEGHDWRAVFDGLRTQTIELWTRLGFEGQKQFLEKRARDWEIRRHRMAPQIWKMAEDLMEKGLFTLKSGGVKKIEREGDHFLIHLEDEVLKVSRIIICAGLTWNITDSESPLLHKLLSDGIIQLDPHQRGLVTDNGRVLPEDNGHQKLWTLGPLRRGELYESISVVEIRCQANSIAKEILECHQLD